ncbi:response regulator [Azospirillum sp. TSO22-1]|uniref:response regulator n=1 Tax=Azospirillum sp. TSO22-1 TaxID=716789 RepID=UPI000D60E388|nr:response regulator [Azospirillum sp. TSO22-1]PWC56502.1 response regulator [Azospirillum sp. TSO22-1]
MNAPLQPRFQVLLVEDDPADAGLAKRAIRDGKILCEVHHATDGVEALDFLHRRGERFQNAPRPDLILLDLNMPRMDGREVLAALKGAPELKTIPVVVLTTSDIERDVEASYLQGANSFITKPMEMQDFVDVIRCVSDYWFHVVKLPK